MQYPNVIVLQSLLLVITMSLTSLTTSAAPMENQHQQQQHQRHHQQLDVPGESSQPHRRSRRSIAKTFISAFPEEIREKWSDIRKRNSLTVSQMAMAAVAHGRQIGSESLLSHSVAETIMAAIRLGLQHKEDDSDGTAALKTGTQTLRMLLLRKLCQKMRDAGEPEADRFCYFSGVED